MFYIVELYSELLLARHSGLSREEEKSAAWPRVIAIFRARRANSLPERAADTNALTASRQYG